MGLIEVVLAVVLIMVMFLPIANMLITGNTVFAQSTNERAATTVAQQLLSVLEQATFPPSNLPTSATSAAAWPSAAKCASTPAVCPAGTSGPLRYQAFETGGWCVLTGTAPYTWGNSASTWAGYATYHVVVKVAWGQQNLSLSSASTTTADETANAELNGTSGAPTTGTVSSCPLGLS